MQDIINEIMKKYDKKKIQSYCKKILKKCSFGSVNDLDNIATLATWLYIYGYYDDTISVCDILKDVEFAGNYSIWWDVEYCYCLKARILREAGNLSGRQELLEIINLHRHPELYANGVEWYRTTINENIQGELEDSPRMLGYGWRIVKLQHAISNREAGGNPIPDEEFERDIKEIVEILKCLK